MCTPRARRPCRSALESKWRTTSSGCTRSGFGPPCRRTTEPLAEIRRTSAGPRVKLGTEELHLLSRLVEDIDEMLAATADDTRTREANDPLVELTGLDLAAAEKLSPPVDPALRRLLPDAYRDDDDLFFNDTASTE